MNISDQRTCGLYVHIPFCIRKCAYCDFTSYPGMEHLFAEYVEALKGEIRAVGSRHSDVGVSTIYFGGGTPNILASGQLADVLNEIHRQFSVAADAEISTEANPGVLVSRAGFDLSTGFNRLSLGFQSLHDDELAILGRMHTAADAIQAFEVARSNGFANISVDLMYGIPKQSRASWRQTLENVLALGPEHISLYSLTVEEGTPFYEMCHAGRLELPGDDLEADMYEDAISTLTAAGYVHYEISNFAKPGYECLHNITYWRNESYFGFGAGAVSYLDGVRTANTSELDAYIASIKSGVSPVVSNEELVGVASMGETVFLGLRMLRGVDLDAFAQRYGVRAENVFADQIGNLVKRGLVEIVGGFLRLTDTGLFLGNEAFAEFVS